MVVMVVAVAVVVGTSVGGGSDGSTSLAAEAAAQYCMQSTCALSCWLQAEAVKVAVYRSYHCFTSRRGRRRGYIGKVMA